MAELSIGDVVVSLCGHDKGDALVVVGIEREYVIVCDGKRRKAEKQKKKKIKHVRALGLHSDLINNLPLHAVDANVRREIKRLAESI